jgi:hypothetical protein
MTVIVWRCFTAFGQVDDCADDLRSLQDHLVQSFIAQVPCATPGMHARYEYIHGFKLLRQALASSGVLNILLFLM